MKREVVKRLQWSIQALAQPARLQSDLFPKDVCVADELALDFEEHCRGLDLDHAGFTTEQERLVRTLERLLVSMSGPRHEELWTDEALESAPEWKRVREAAINILRAMSWSDGPPPRDRAIYVSHP